MIMPPRLASAARARPVPVGGRPSGQILHVDVSLAGGGRWRLVALLSLIEPPDSPPPLTPALVGFRGVVTGRSAPLVVESIRWAGYPATVEIIAAPLAGRADEADRDEVLLILDLAPWLLPGLNAAPFHLHAAPAPAAAGADLLDIDYCAKDYQQFRDAMLRRMAVLYPSWTDRNPADIGVTVIEVLAYAADYASQYQDAVAAEAYLATARTRASVKRHARLLDYRTDEGRSSRLWVHLDMRRPIVLRAGTRLFAGGHLPGLVDRETADAARLVFETMADAQLHPALNALSLYGFRGRGQTLSEGACHAVLVVRREARELLLAAGRGHWTVPGAVLAFSPSRTAAAHPVRVINARDLTMRLEPEIGERGLSIVDIEWAVEDALPVAMHCGAGGGDDAGADAICFGNLVLADFGRTVEEDLAEAPVPNMPYRPVLAQPFVVYAAPLPNQAAGPVSAAGLSLPDHLEPVPVVRVSDDLGDGPDGAVWHARNDLFTCLPDERAFTIEPSQNHQTTLRFGDGCYGRKPSADRRYRARYRVGDLAHASVRPHTITALAPAPGQGPDELQSALVRLTNVTAALGARVPESIERARVRAPQAMRTPISCVTLADYVAAAERIAGVGEARARVRQQHGVAVIEVTVRSGILVWTPARLIDAVRQDLAARCLAGRRVSVTGPTLVPLDIEVAVQLAPGARELDVQTTLGRRFSSDDGGMFSPRSIRFGQTVFASTIIAAALSASGVVSADIRRLARTGDAPDSGLAPAALLLGGHEVPLVTGAPDTSGGMRLLFKGAR